MESPTIWLIVIISCCALRDVVASCCNSGLLSPWVTSHDNCSACWACGSFWNVSRQNYTYCQRISKKLKSELLNYLILNQQLIWNIPLIFETKDLLSHVYLKFHVHYSKSFARYAGISNPNKSSKLLFKLYAFNKTYFIRRGFAQAGSVIVKGGRECVRGWGGAGLWNAHRKL